LVIEVYSIALSALISRDCGMVFSAKHHSNAQSRTCSTPAPGASARRTGIAPGLIFLSFARRRHRRADPLRAPSGITVVLLIVAATLTWLDLRVRTESA
jgi:hypothetical protein